MGNRNNQSKIVKNPNTTRHTNIIDIIDSRISHNKIQTERNISRNENLSTSIDSYNNNINKKSNIVTKENSIIRKKLISPVYGKPNNQSINNNIIMNSIENKRSTSNSRNK